jgi:protein-tyrosine-phosphatase
MTPAQRQAWNYFSGKSTYDCMCNGHFVCAGVNMAGSHISPTSLEWLRKEGYKIIDKISRFKKETNQIKGLDLPEDIIHRTEKPVDTVRMTIDQNKARSAGIFEVCLKGGSTGVSHPFMTELAVHHLIQLEEQIIRAEWEKTKKSPDPYDDHERDTNEYIQARAECKKVLGLEFQKYYEESRASHNSCAEANLKNSDRHLFCWVLPKFNDDGTHEPWTEEMTPRNDYEPLKAMMKK